MRSRPASKQLTLELHPRSSHGGRRPGAGRKRASTLQPHRARERFRSHEPLHINLKLAPGLPELRRKRAFACLRLAVCKAREKGLRIVHFSILSNHLHLIVEAPDRRALARQMQSFGISFARRLNALMGREGAVFRDRYYSTILRTPTQVRNAIRYVLLNERNHSGNTIRVKLDEYSTAPLVSDSIWARLIGTRWRRVVGFPEEADPESHRTIVKNLKNLTSEPRSWLLRAGWKRARASDLAHA